MEGPRGAGGVLRSSRAWTSRGKPSKRCAKTVLTASSTSARLRKLLLSASVPPLGASCSRRLAEQAHVGVTEAVDRLQLVADGEEVPALEGRQDRQLTRVGVLELVDHQQLEALSPGLAQQPVPGEQLARDQLEVVEVDCDQIALEALVALPEQAKQAIEEQDGGHAIGFVGPRPRCGGRLRQARVALPAAAQLGEQLRDRVADGIDAVGGEEVDGLGGLTSQELPQRPARRREACRRAARPASRTRKSGSRPAGSGCARSTRMQKPWKVPMKAASVSRAASRRPSSSSRSRTRERSSPAARSVKRDRQHRRGRDAVVADRLHEALDEHRGLAAARRGREQDRLRAPAHRLVAARE